MWVCWCVCFNVYFMMYVEIMCFCYKCLLLFCLVFCKYYSSFVLHKVRWIWFILILLSFKYDFLLTFFFMGTISRKFYVDKSPRVEDACIKPELKLWLFWDTSVYCTRFMIFLSLRIIFSHIWFLSIFILYDNKI